VRGSAARLRAGGQRLAVGAPAERGERPLRRDGPQALPVEAVQAELAVAEHEREQVHCRRPRRARHICRQALVQQAREQRGSPSSSSCPRTRDRLPSAPTSTDAVTVRPSWRTVRTHTVRRDAALHMQVRSTPISISMSRAAQPSKCYRFSDASSAAPARTSS